MSAITPVSPSPSDNSSSLPPSTSPTTAPTAPGAPVKRKASRRANTAERRATHNAVERQRRETLNGRFLDLAALLPNLASVRRPSKSAIVNSSIALIHSQRRLRLQHAREMRALLVESDALRREANEWRARCGVVRLEQPPRSAEVVRMVDELTRVAAGDERREEEEERRAWELAGAAAARNDDDDAELVDDGAAFHHVPAPAPAPAPQPVQPAFHREEYMRTLYPHPQQAPLPVQQQPQAAAAYLPAQFAYGSYPAPQHDADKVAQWQLQLALAEPHPAPQGQGWTIPTPPGTAHGSLEELDLAASPHSSGGFSGEPASPAAFNPHPHPHAVHVGGGGGSGGGLMYAAHVMAPMGIVL